MNIIGLGHAGCEIASNFQNYDNYKTFFIDCENPKKRKNFFKVKQQSSHEDYEKNYKNINFSKIEGESTIILTGCGKISGITLRLLEQLKHLKLTILYVKPDLSTSDDLTKTRHKIVFGILQEYARSNLLSEMIIFSNEKVEKIIDGVSIATYWQDINNVISSTYNMLLYFRKTEPLLDSLSNKAVTCKVASPGIVNYSSFGEELLYELEKPRHKKYFFCLSEQTLQSKKTLLTDIRTYVKQQANENCNSCFAIYSSTYDQDYVYTLHYASLLQEQNLDL
mgnify:FL=1